MHIEIDVWIRGTQHAITHRVSSVPPDATTWDEAHVKHLITEMLLALNREKNPGSEAPEVVMRGFSWIVSPYEGGVVVHLETQIGTVSAGPFAVAEDRLTKLIARVMQPADTNQRVH